MRCTVAFNNVMTECTYSYKKEGAVIRAHSVFARYWVTLRLEIEITLNFVSQLTDILDEAHTFRLKLILKYESVVRTPFTGEMSYLLYSLQE